MERRVVITGLGAICPVGNTVADFWESLKAGKSGLNFIQGYDDVDLPVRIVAQVKDFDPIANGLERADVRKMDLYCQYAIAAANQAVKDSGLVSGENIEPGRFGVYVGSGIGGISAFVRETGKYLEEGARRISPLFIPTMIANIASGNIAIRHKAEGPCLPVVTACATGTHSVGEAYHAIKFGFADAIITGGAEAAVHPLAIGGFANSRALTSAETLEDACTPFDARRSGFTMADGAGVLVLEEYEHAVKRGATIYAEVAGYGNTCDAHHYTAPRPDGIPASKAIRMALDEAGYTSADTLYINAHGTSTPLNDKTETYAIKLALGEEDARRALISSTKSMTGHMLGAAGGIELIATALAVKHGIVPPTINYREPDPECDLNYVPNKAVEVNVTMAASNSLGFGGHNACVVLKKV
ncbi:MAG: beta-ketoacyl-ACP synthase II [Bacteroidaceae bacterium]|nr:beta-ketoacyl-ACP synthase II [Bacteroidaceae bacterium]MBR3984117.1 beta-ketoacyl-ACP synthase II [Bacteroidaceae bacterium]MBR4041855.1 beta-ketoacyl-ACP synthase II [Bacteroidaceae bacterium]